MTIGYYLELETEGAGDDRYAVIQQFLAGGELATQYEWENCTLTQALSHLAELYRTKPPEGMVQG